MAMLERRLISTGSPFEERAGYSRALIKGDWCFVAGTTGYDYDTMRMPHDTAEQTRNAMKTIENILKEAGFALSDVVRVVYYITNPGFSDDVIAVVGELFRDIRPAATMVVTDLIKSEMKVEIEVTAFRG